MATGKVVQDDALLVERARPLTDSLLQQTMPLLRAIMDSAHEAVRQVLTPEQRERLDSRFPDGFPGRRPFDRGPGFPPGDGPPPPPGQPGAPPSEGPGLF